MRRSFSRALGDGLLSVFAVGVLLTVLVIADTRVRDQVSLRMGSAQASTELAAAGSQVRSLAAVIIEVAKDQSQNHAPLMILVVSASLLTLFMVRT